MEQKGLRIGHIVALAGAFAALLALWRPWYSVEIPPQVRDLLGGSGQLGQDPGLMGQLSRSLATALPSSLEASGWKELEGADLVLCVGALAVAVLVIGAAGAFGNAVRIDPNASGSAIAAIGAVLLVVVLVHVVHKPGGAQAADFLHLEQGIWIALAGSTATLAGGLMAAAKPRDPSSAPHTTVTPTTFGRLEPELPPVFVPASSQASVPPPG
jgi:hypothetical protein